jgi:hypothetical protein
MMIVNMGMFAMGMGIVCQVHPQFPVTLTMIVNMGLFAMGMGVVWQDLIQVMVSSPSQATLQEADRRTRLSQVVFLSQVLRVLPTYSVSP